MNGFLPFLSDSLPKYGKKRDLEMEKNPDFDFEKLVEEARSSDYGEGYVVVSRGNMFKIGLVARIEESGNTLYSLELLVRLMEENREVDPSRIKNILDITGILTERGYYMTSEEGGWIFAECNFTSDRIKDESEFLISLMEENIPR